MKLALTFALNTLFNFAIGLMVAKFLGPAEYGRFALALAVAVFINTALFDWIRLAATRFYSERVRVQNPAVRAALDVAFAALAALLGIAALAVLLAGVEVQLSSALVALAVATGVANGLFDYHTALVRARFLDPVYSRLIIAKNILGLTFTVGGAWWFGSAKAALIGICLCVAGALVTARRALHDEAARPALAARPLILTHMRYGLPIVIAGLLYQAIPLANRSLITSQFGFAETGQYSLAYDIGIRLVAAIGSTLDVMLFQIAVLADEQHGIVRARQQVARNINLVLALVLPACAGFWLTLPSLEALIVPAAYRGPFGHFLTLLLPGLFCYAMAVYGLNPMFQIVKRTGPMIAAALFACAVNVALLALLPRGADASSFAMAHSAALAAGCCALAAFAVASKPVWPDGRDALITLAATATMVGLLAPLRALPPGFGTLVLQAAAGVAAYGFFVFAFDMAGLRARVMGFLRVRTAGA